MIEAIEPYLYYADGALAVDWLRRVVGFDEVARWLDGTGAVAEAELLAGSSRIHVSGGHPTVVPTGILLIVTVDDVDAHHAHTTAEGVPAAPPQDQPYGARTYSVRDPQGYEWSFWQRLPTGVALLPGWQEVRA